MHDRFPRGPAVRFPPPFLFVAGFLLGWFLQRVWPMPLVPVGRTPAAAILGFVLVLGGLGVLLWAFVTFWRHRTAIIPNRPAARLVTGGPYRISRNPMYVGLTLTYLGIVLATNLVWPLVLLPVVLIALGRLVIDREERYLTAAFGDEYDRYREKVRRWM